MNTNRHIIRRQTAELQISRSDNALVLQQRFIRLLEEQLLPRLEPVFDRLAGPDTWIELDRLDIDLGRLAPGESDQVWLDKALRAYTAALEQQLGKPQTQRAAAPGRQSDLIAYFLTHGALPWWAGPEPLDAVVRAQLPALAARLPTLLSPAAARRRWVLQFDDAVQQEAFDAVAASLSGKAASAQSPMLDLAAWLDIFAPAAAHRHYRNRYWEILWEAAVQGGATGIDDWLPILLAHGFSELPDAAAVGQAFERLLASGYYAASQDLVKRSWWIAATETLQRRIRALPFAARQKAVDTIQRQWRLLSRRFPGEQARVQDVLKAVQLAAGEQQPAGKLPGTPGAKPAPPAARPEATRPFASPPADPDGLLVPLAGAVLLHPFLPTFFDRLGLLRDGHFTGEAAQERAVHLLYHLATGLQHPAETELPLLKLLCGAPVEAPLERELDLTDAERIESEQLLRALAGQWTAVGELEPNDLRGSFFVRDGKLRRGDMGWNLTVETKTWDILLTKLPWGLSPVMHTWMREMLWVDWI